jgi:hypothetical protein
MDTDRFTDRLLEAENLTDNLEDNEANILIDWGINQLDPLVRDLEDGEIAGEKVNALMKFMRGINGLVGSLADVSPEGLQDLVERYALVFGEAHRVEQAEYEMVAAKVVNMSPGDAVQFLLEWVLPARPNENIPADPNETELPPPKDSRFRPAKAV